MTWIDVTAKQVIECYAKLSSERSRLTLETTISSDSWKVLLSTTSQNTEQSGSPSSLLVSSSHPHSSPCTMFELTIVILSSPQSPSLHLHIATSVTPFHHTHRGINQRIIAGLCVNVIGDRPQGRDFGRQLLKPSVVLLFSLVCCHGVCVMCVRFRHIQFGRCQKEQANATRLVVVWNERGRQNTTYEWV